MAKPAYDAVVVGSGAGGGAAAWALTRKGLRVLILEAGPRYDPFKDYKASTRDWEEGFPVKTGSQGRYTYGQMQALSGQWSQLRSWNHVSGLLNTGDRRVSFGYHHVRAVGGSSLHFTGEAHRLNQQSMRLHSRFGVAADWPLSYQDLEPHYLAAERFVGVAGPGADFFRPRSAPFPYEAHPLGFSTRFLQKGFAAKGMQLVANPLAVLPEARENRPACNYCGCCLKGCPRTDKGTIDVTYLRAAEASGLCEIRTDTTVVRIETEAGGKVRGVHYLGRNGAGFIETPKLVLAAGAIETPRLLLASRDMRSPKGLANESGQVGRNFMETLLWTSNALCPEDLGSHRGLPVDSICWTYNAPDSIPGVVGGCRFSPSVAESDLLGPINYAKRVVKGWGRAHKLAMRSSFGKVLSLSGICESLPHPESYVALDPSVKDSTGVAVARIHSHVDDMAIRRIAFMAKNCRDILKACGAGPIFEEFSSYDIFSSTHVFGTCRMGVDPRNSVVDAWCRSHRWGNLYIVDASVFPSTGGGESPGLTVQALALRAMGAIDPAT